MATRYKNCPDCSFRCGAKPVSEFGNDASTPDGLSTYCKDCRNSRQREWKKNNPSKVAQWRRNYIAANKKRNLKKRQQNSRQQGAP